MWFLLCGFVGFVLIVLIFMLVGFGVYWFYEVVIVEENIC